MTNAGMSFLFHDASVLASSNGTKAEVEISLVGRRVWDDGMLSGPERHEIAEIRVLKADDMATHEADRFGEVWTELRQNETEDLVLQYCAELWLPEALFEKVVRMAISFEGERQTLGLNADIPVKNRDFYEEMFREFDLSDPHQDRPCVPLSGVHFYKNTGATRVPVAKPEVIAPFDGYPAEKEWPERVNLQTGGLPQSPGVSRVVRVAGWGVKMTCECGWEGPSLRSVVQDPFERTQCPRGCSSDRLVAKVCRTTSGPQKKVL